MSEEEYQAWVAAANADWEAAEQLRRSGSYALAVFHFQQAAEKRLKAICALTDRPAFTHSLVVLLKKLGELGYDVDADRLHDARKLDVHYTQSRYPGGLGVAPSELYDDLICSEARQWSHDLIAFAESLRLTKTP